MSTRPETTDVALGGKALSESELVTPSRLGDEAGRSTWRRIIGNRWVLRAIFYSAILVGWQVTAVVKGFFFLPTIPQTIRGFGEVFTEGYAGTLLGSLRQLFVGFLIALTIAIPIGVLMGRFRFVEDVLAPYVNTLFVTPKQALLPVIIVAVGIGFWYRTWIVILFSVFFPIINTAAGVRYVDKELRETAQAFGTSRWRMFSRIYLPASAPFVVAGIRLGFGMAMKGMVIAELWIFSGTGNLLETFSRSPLRLDLYYPLVLLIIGFAVIVNELLKWAERKLRPAAQAAGQV